MAAHSVCPPGESGTEAWWTKSWGRKLDMTGDFAHSLLPLDRFFWSMFSFHKSDPHHLVIQLSLAGFHGSSACGVARQCWAGENDRASHGRHLHVREREWCGLTPWHRRATESPSWCCCLCQRIVQHCSAQAPTSQKPCVDPDCLSQQSLKSGPSATAPNLKRGRRKEEGRHRKER